MKLDVNIFNHPKIRRIRRMPEGDSIFTLWIYFLCEGMKNTDNPGVIELTAGIPANDIDISEDTRIKIDTVQMAIQVFMELGMIIVDPINNGAMGVKNLAKHQSLAQLEYKRELNRQRVERFRQKKKVLELENNSEDVMHYNDYGNEQIRVDKIRIDKNRLDKSKEEKAIKKNNFKKPTIDEINDYLKEKNIDNIDAEKFYYHYEANGWMRGKSKIKSWKACIRTWKINNKKWDDDKKNKLTPLQENALKILNPKPEEVEKFTAFIKKKSVNDLKKIRYEDRYMV